MIILAIYVDDGLIAAENEEAIEPVIDHLRKEFEVIFLLRQNGFWDSKWINVWMDQFA